ncbi:MAG: sulfatase [Spirochaetales bacterium]|jgi:N-sulfoglucosamine sulfohydrolase|nr:sulfatase [Spirochaetales bacterium]
MNRPNILMITSHDLGQHLCCYGVNSVQTENIDELASRGVRFSNFYSTSAVCSPGRGSLHTGRYPQSNGLMGLTHAPWWWSLNRNERHTAEILGDLGYISCLAGVNHIDGDPKRLGYEEIHSEKQNADDTVRETEALIFRAEKSENPFFIKAGFFEVHRPFVQGTDTQNGVFVPPWLADTDTVRNDLAAFQATIKYFDSCVGQILSAVEISSIAENTLVILTSDHGIPYPGAKWTVRKAGIETPFIAYQPKTAFSGGKVFENVTSNVDVLPTLLDYLGEVPSSSIQGFSFLELVNGKRNTGPRRHAFSQYTPEMKRDNLSRSVINDRYHLIRYFDQGRTVTYPVDVDPHAFAAHVQRCPTTGARPFAQLYDIREDPYELNDIGPDPKNAAVVGKLSKEVLAWMQEVKDPILDGPQRTPYYDKAMSDFYSYTK